MHAVRALDREFDQLRPLSIAVNLSGRQFLDTGLTNAVASAIAQSGLDPHNLLLEITEGTMLKDTETTAARFQQLRDIGVRLALDDFGTGYSSLSSLHKFPIDVLKIDRSFIDNINNDEGGVAMARAIISMGETLRLATIAEGIEKPEQVAMLRSLGCEMGQGYLFARPLPAKEMTEFLRDAAASNIILPDIRRDVPPPAVSGPIKQPAFHI